MLENIALVLILECWHFLRYLKTGAEISFYSKSLDVNICCKSFRHFPFNQIWILVGILLHSLAYCVGETQVSKRQG